MYVKPLTEAEQDEKRIIAEITKKSTLELRSYLNSNIYLIQKHKRGYQAYSGKVSF